MMQQDLPGLATLLAGMRDAPSVPDGWDAVLNLSQSAVQSLVQSNWRGMSKADGDGALVRDHSLFWVAPADVDGQHDVIEVRTDLPFPTVGLNVSDQAIHLDFAIDSGTLQIGTVAADFVAELRDARAAGGSGKVVWSQCTAITPENPLKLAGPIPVDVEAAIDGRRFSIVLSLAGSVITLSGRDDGGFSTQAVTADLTHWLAAHGLSDRIGCLVLPEGAHATVLTPAAVASRVVTSVEGAPVLQLLTSASPGAQVPSSCTVVPHPDTQDFSVIVGSRATMTMIANGYNLGTGDIKLVSLPPADGQGHWFAHVHQPMVFEGNFGNQDGTIYVRDHAKLYMCFGGSAEQGLKLFTTTDPASTIRLQLELDAHYPVEISAADVDQVVGLRAGEESVTANGFYEAIVQPQLEKFLAGDIRSDMSRVRMTAISDLVLRDLTLSGHRLNFDIAALPAELLIAGRLIPDV